MITISGRAIPENGRVRVRVALRTPLTPPPRRSQDPHFSIFLKFSRPAFTVKSLISGNIKLQGFRISKKISFKTSKWVKTQFTWLHFVEKIQFTGVPKIDSGPFTNPSVRPFGPQTYTKLKV